MHFIMKWNAIFFAFLCFFILMVQIETLKDVVSSSPAPSSEDMDYDEYSDETPKKRKGGGVCPLLSLTNGRVRLRSRGRIAKFLCRFGFQAFGKRFATCIRGRWNAQPPLCISRGCPTFVPPPNGRMSMEYRGALVNFACNPGFTLVGSRSLYCDGTKWNSTAPNCEVSVENPQLSCDFERDDLCGWSHDPTHDFDWKRFNLVTPSGHVGTGPSHDHTLGEGRDGFYMYIEASSPRVENDTARLFSPVYKAEDSQDACFRFWYHMYGATSGFLRVFVKPASGDFSSLLPKFSVGGDQGNKWHSASVAISPLTEPFQIVIEGIRGPSYVSDTAIDDVQLTFGSDCAHNADDNNNGTVLFTFSGSDVSPLSVSSEPLSRSEAFEMTSLTPLHQVWPSTSPSVTSVLPDVVSSTSGSSVNNSKKIDLQTVAPLSIGSSSASSISTSVSSVSLSILTTTTRKPPSNTFSTLYLIRTQQPTKWTTTLSPPSPTSTNAPLFLTSSKYTFPPRTSTKIFKTTTKWSPKRNDDRVTTTPSTTKKFNTNPSSPTVSSTATTTAKLTTRTVPYFKTEMSTARINQWAIMVTSGPLSLKNITRSAARYSTTTSTNTPPPPPPTTTTTTTSTTSRPTTRSIPRTLPARIVLTTHMPRYIPTTQMPRIVPTTHMPRYVPTTHIPRYVPTTHIPRYVPTTHMPTRPNLVTPVVTSILAPPSTEKSNEIELFPEESYTTVTNGRKVRPLPPWTYMKRPSMVDRESRGHIFSNVAAAHVADGQVSVATGAGMFSVLVVVIAVVVFLIQRIRRRNEGRQEALNEDSDVRYLKDGEVRVEFCDLHLRYIGQEDDSGL